MIAKAEQVEVDVAALELLAAGARGGFRDAISAFDQVASGGQRPITVATVRVLLGYSDNELIGAVSRAIAAGDARAALVALDDLQTGGAQPGQLTLQLVDQWRSIMLTATGAVVASDVTVTELASIGAVRAAGVVTDLLEAARSSSPREALEAAVVMLAMVGTVAPSAPIATPAPVARKGAAPEPDPATPAAPSDDAARWPKVVMLIKQKHNSLAALLAMYPIELTDQGITIKSRFNFHRDLFLKAQNRQAIETAAEKVYGRPLPVHAVTEDGGMKVASRPKTDSSTELISSALEILGGEVVD